jgi:MFS family permease
MSSGSSTAVLEVPVVLETTESDSFGPRHVGKHLESLSIGNFSEPLGRSVSVQSGASSGVQVSVHNSSSVTSITRSRYNGLNIEEDNDDDGIDYPEGGREAWTVVFGVFLGLTAFYGTSNSIGAIQAYFELNQLEGISASKVSWIFSIYVFLVYIVSMQTGFIFDAYGPYHLLVAGSILYCSCLIVTSFCKEYYQFLLAFGIGCGLGGSMLVTPLIGVVSHWFNHKRGIATGFASAGGSLGGTIFPIMLRQLFAKTSYGWAIRVLAFINMVCLITAILLVRTRLPKVNLEIKLSSFVDFSCLKDKRFLYLTLAVFICELSLLNGITYLASSVIATGVDQTTAFNLLAVVNAAGIPGRWLAGFISDRFGRFNTMIGSTLLAALVILCLWLPLVYSTPAMMVFAVVYGLASATVLTVTPVCCGQISKTRDYGRRFGTMYFFVSFGALFGIPVSGALIHGQDYKNFIILCGVLYFVSAIFFWISRYFCVGNRWCKV